MNKVIALCVSGIFLSGCTTARLADSVEKKAINSDKAVIESHDKNKEYSTAMQLMYLGTQKEPDRHNNLDELSKDYYKNIDTHNSAVSLGAVLVWTQTLSVLDTASFFFGTSKYDKLFGHYKGDTLLFIEPFSNQESTEDAYLRTNNKLKSIIQDAYTENEYAIFEYEESVFGDITKFITVWNNADDDCKNYLESEDFTPLWLDAPKEYRECHVRKDGFIWNPKVIHGTLDIDGVPKADNYFVVSYVAGKSLKEAAIASGLSGVYSYEPAYTWRSQSSLGKNYSNDPELVKADINLGIISPFPYLVRVEDNTVMMFKAN
ncbi:hypothetical protein PTW35_18955 (plasmid) [Photobacterium sp. DA100]|uniref:hypothetical protein n=1 Tax=Photobacterium sp. DA100 TaxID=3027472 RepID=UPI00247AB0B0|nr:hypothetical protein [Photobacterium sp. DA100]WEM45172.1 hypothetical protein PTW35_18955 [Photobacterium sp. DA100]